MREGDFGLPTIKIDEEKCKGCQLCIHFCPKQVIEVAEYLNAKGFHPARLVDEENCSGCATCALMCPDVCIQVFREEKAAAKKNAAA